MELLAIIFVLLGFLVIGVGTCIVIANIMSALRARRRSKNDELNENREAQQEKLRYPKYRDVEKLLRCRFPNALKYLYEQKELVCQTDFYFIDPTEDKSSWSIAFFLPVSSDSIHDCWPDLPDACFFARTMHGQYYYVPFDSDAWAPTSVFVIDIRSGETTKISDSLVDFLNWPRVSAAQYHKHHG
jgi:hypothetical protein